MFIYLLRSIPILRIHFQKVHYMYTIEMCLCLHRNVKENVKEKVLYYSYVIYYNAYLYVFGRVTGYIHTKYSHTFFHFDFLFFGKYVTNAL